MNFTDDASTTPEQYHPVLLTNSTSTTWTSYVYISCNLINVILGLPANCYVLWLMLTGRGAGVVSDFYSLNLTACEILYCSGCLIAFSLSPLKYIMFQSFISVFPVYARPLFLCLICVERYVAVVYPVIFVNHKSLRYRVICSAVVWVLLAGFGVFCMFILSSYNTSLFFCVVLPQYLLFLMIKLFCGFAVLRALKYQGPGERVRQREANNLKKKAFNIILIFTVAMVINYTPFLLGGILYHYLSVNCFIGFWTISVCISVAVSFVSPVMYIRQYGNLKLVTSFIHKFTTIFG